MRGHRFGRIGSLLGLFAILLVLCAPIVSQSLHASAPAGFGFLDICSANDLPATGGGHDSAPATHGQACAYCSFAHVFPALTGGAAAAVARVEWSAYAPAATAAPVRAFEAPVSAPPRAPPVPA